MPSALRRQERNHLKSREGSLRQFLCYALQRGAGQTGQWGLAERNSAIKSSFFSQTALQFLRQPPAASPLSISFPFSAVENITALCSCLAWLQRGFREMNQFLPVEHLGQFHSSGCAGGSPPGFEACLMCKGGQPQAQAWTAVVVASNLLAQPRPKVGTANKSRDFRWDS